jgi:aryl-alcohol dehydrogenase-like predicted oxidoreductase
MSSDDLQHTILGRTGTRVSRMGLGGGGHSRLGARTGRSRTESIALVRRAIELGINFIDTAESYGTEEVIGEGIRQSRVPREQVVISTKKGFPKDQSLSPAELRAALEASLRRLGTNFVDVYHLHGLHLSQYDHAISVLVPELVKLKESGKIRAIGITEAFNSDRRHDMLRRAMRDAAGT